MEKPHILGMLSVFIVSLTACGQDPNGETDTPIELGQVHWGRELDKAEALSEETGKPLFVQFQEVPG